MITITNDFHNKQVTLRANIGDTLTQAQVSRARAKLCGHQGCLCGGEAGQRGQQDGFELETIGYRVVRVVGR